jgi:hypothetical protein
MPNGQSSGDDTSRTLPPPTRWRLVATHRIRPNQPQDRFALPAGEELVVRDLLGDDDRILSEMIVPGRLPEIPAEDYHRDVGLWDLIDQAGIAGGEYLLGGMGDFRDTVVVLWRGDLYDPEEVVPTRSAFATVIYHNPRTKPPRDIAP